MNTSNKIADHDQISSLFLRTLIITLITLLVTQAQAQDKCVTALEDAEEVYYINRFDEVIKILNQCPPSNFPEEAQKLRGYKLLALAYIAKDSSDKAKDEIKKLLNLSPKYEPNPDLDPKLFGKLLIEIKKKQQQTFIVQRSKKKWLWIGGGTALGSVVTFFLVKNKNDQGGFPNPPGRPAK